jgi:hypothetical protein
MTVHKAVLFLPKTPHGQNHMDVIIFIASRIFVVNVNINGADKFGGG